MFQFLLLLLQVNGQSVGQDLGIVAPTLNTQELQSWKDFSNALETVGYQGCKQELSVVLNQAQNAFNNYGVSPNFFTSFRRIGNQSGDIEEATEFRKSFADFNQIIIAKEKEYAAYVQLTKEAILKQQEDAKQAEELAATVANTSGDDEIVSALSEEEQLSMYGVDANSVQKCGISLLAVGLISLMF